MTQQNINASRALNLIVAHYRASEDTPLRMGNCDFWHPVPGFAAALCYSIPTLQWDHKAITADLNRLTESWWEEFCTAMKLPPDGLDEARDLAAHEADARNMRKQE